MKIKKCSKPTKLACFWKTNVLHFVTWFKCLDERQKTAGLWRLCESTCCSQSSCGDLARLRHVKDEQRERKFDGGVEWKPVLRISCETNCIFHQSDWCKRTSFNFRNEEETSKNKEDIVNREMTLLKKIFLSKQNLFPWPPALDWPKVSSSDLFLCAMHPSLPLSSKS